MIKSRKFAEAFESRGVERQYGAITPKMAQDAFASSCDRCCTIGISLDCDRCGIAVAHSSIMSIFDSTTKAIS